MNTATPDAESENEARSYPALFTTGNPPLETGQMSLSAKILHGAQGCPIARDSLCGMSRFDRLSQMLSRWQSLGFPDPRLELGVELLVEFEAFLDAYENQA